MFQSILWSTIYWIIYTFSPFNKNCNPNKTPEVKEQKDEKVIRKEVMEELTGDGSCPAIRWGKNTNCTWVLRSSFQGWKIKQAMTEVHLLYQVNHADIQQSQIDEIITGKVSNPGGGWDDVPDIRQSVPPNPTNMQTALACTGWNFDPPCETKASRRRVLGALLRTKKPGVSGLRSRSVGRTVQDYNDDRYPMYVWIWPDVNSSCPQSQY